MVIASHIHAITGLLCLEGLLWDCICARTHLDPPLNTQNVQRSP